MVKKIWKEELFLSIMAGKLHYYFLTNTLLVFSSFFPFLKKAAAETLSSLFKFISQLSELVIFIWGQAFFMAPFTRLVMK
ncbi:hypothetical protein [Desulfobacula sp.]|uniref:hypothetical protein n=1 Tax=Desulfobacula sp. TaxID=2593537 RepID=UPI00260431AD|nr:hypothetical protein [Desulfobacula sp.]